MMYWKFSENRIFFLNEYWILVPSAIVVNYFLIRKLRLDKKRIEQLKNLARQIEREKKIKKILLLSIGLNLGLGGYLAIISRGGSTLINTDYIKCDLEEGIRYLDNARLKKIILHLFRHKMKEGIIYITATALCHLANRYGQIFLPLPIAIGDFGFTNAVQALRKSLVVLLLGAIGPLVVLDNPIALILAFALGTSGLRLAFTNLDLIATSAVDLTKDLRTRIPGVSEVVVIHNRNKLVMKNPVRENLECSLPDQHLFNPNCKLKPTEIPDAIDLALPNLKYEEMVNMHDLTGLDRVEFTDKFDLGQTKPNIYNPRKGKEVNLLEKFGDSKLLEENQGWDISENDFIVPKRRYLRRRNEL